MVISVNERDETKKLVAKAIKSQLPIVLIVVPTTAKSWHNNVFKQRKSEIDSDKTNDALPTHKLVEKSY